MLNHIGISPFQMWDGDVEHSRWLMEVRIPSSSHGAQRFCFPWDNLEGLRGKFRPMAAAESNCCVCFKSSALETS